MRLYTDLAPWFHLLTAPEEYREEAELYRRLIRERVSGRAERLLELGCGGGNNASHLKTDFRLTLTDLSPAMLEVSRGLNPECEHRAGDMRTLRLGRTFDAVYVHDAVMYMATERDLRAAMATAVEHCRPGGVVLFTPDCVRETFHPYEIRGGHDGADGRSLRYRERGFEPKPGGRNYQVELTLRLREADGGERVEREEYTFGLFSLREWTDWLTAAGVRVEAMPTDMGDEGAPSSYLFLGARPA